MKLKNLLCSLGLTIFCSLGMSAQEEPVSWFNFQWEDAVLDGKKVENRL